MFTCNACLHRALILFASTARTAKLIHRLPGYSLERAATAGFIPSRHHATFQSIRKGHHRRDLLKSLRRPTRPSLVKRPKPDNARVRSMARDAQARENNRLRRLEPEAREKYLKQAMSQEAKYLVDPLKLAQGTVEKLRDHKLEEALALVRASDKALDGKGIDSIVSWNHIIDWLMGQESPGEAWKIYQEV